MMGTMGNNLVADGDGTLNPALEKICAHIYNLARYQLTIEQLACELNVLPAWLREHLADELSPVYTAYHKGISATHKGVFDMLMESITADRNVNAMRHYDFVYRQKTVMAPIKVKEENKEVIVTVRYEEEPIKSDDEDDEAD